MRYRSNNVSSLTIFKTVLMLNLDTFSISFFPRSGHQDNKDNKDNGRGNKNMSRQTNVLKQQRRHNKDF